MSRASRISKMNWKLPNQLTVGRILLSAVFFTLLGLYRPGPATALGAWVLNAALGVYILAGITDMLDGYLARRWNLTSVFGRIVDPLVDKVLVVGAFVMLTGSNYVIWPGCGAPDAAVEPALLNGGMLSGVQAWMVVVILAREFLVSAVRGYSESRGMKFPAIPAGKIKMFVQSFTICAVLFQLANVPDPAWAVYAKLILVWLAVLVTVFSALWYVGKIRRLLRSDE